MNTPVDSYDAALQSSRNSGHGAEILGLDCRMITIDSANYKFMHVSWRVGFRNKIPRMP